MANTGEILGSGVNAELDELVKRLVQVKEEVKVINGQTINLSVKLDGVTSLAELTRLLKLKEELENKSNAATMETVQTYHMATEAIKAHNGQTQKVVAVSDKIAATMLKEAKARQANAKAILDEQKYVAALTKEKENQEKKAQKAAESAAKETNAYLQLRKEYNAQSTALKGMVVQYGEADAAVVKMKADVDKMYVSLLKAEEAVGQHQRKVGQYSSLSNSFSQIIREAPAFAYSFSTGIMGISNNIPPLLDDLKRLKQANKEAAEAGGEQKTTWDSLKESLFSINGLITIGVGLFTILAARWDNATESMSDADIAAKELSDTISDLNNIVSKGYLQELTETNDLFRVSSDLGLSYDVRVNAIEELMKLYPGLLSNLENEAFLTGNVADKQDLIAKVISKKNYIKYYEGIAEEMTKQKDILQKKFDENNAAGFLGFYNPFSTKGTSEDIANQEAAINKLQSDIDDAKKMKQILQDELKYIMNPKHEGRILSDIDADIREQQRKRDNNAAEKKEHIEAISRLKELEEERRKFLGEDEKRKKKPTISDELATAKAEYELQLLLNQQKFNNSRKTYTESEQLNKDNLQATKDYGEKYVLIVEDFNKRVGMSEEDHKKHILDANKILLEGLNKAKEAQDKIQEEIIKKHIQANDQLLKYIDSLTKQRQELEKINREIDAIQDKAAARKEYAESFAPVLEGFGFNTSFGQSVKQKNLDIEAQRANVGAAMEAEANEGIKGSMADAIKLGELRIKTANEQKNLKQMEFELEDMYNQKIIEGKKELARKTVELAKNAVEAINTIRNNQFAAEQQQLEIQTRNLKISSEQQMRAIEAKAGFEAAKTNEKSILAAQTTAKENELRTKSNELALRQARANKQAAQAAIIANTASAIVKAFVDFPYPVAIPIAAALAATGAVQYAAASSAPLPQFEKGGKTSTEYFIAGEKGSELMISPSGRVSMSSDTAKVHKADIGTKIIPADETAKIIKYAAQSVGLSQYDISMIQTAQNNKVVKEVAKIVGDKFEDVAQDIIYGLYASRVQPKDLGSRFSDAVREQSNLIARRA